MISEVSATSTSPVLSTPVQMQVGEQASQALIAAAQALNRTAKDLTGAIQAQTIFVAQRLAAMAQDVTEAVRGQAVIAEQKDGEKTTQVLVVLPPEPAEREAPAPKPESRALRTAFYVASAATAVGLVGVYVSMNDKDKHTTEACVKFAGKNLAAVGSLFWANGKVLAGNMMSYLVPTSFFLGDLKK